MGGGISLEARGKRAWAYSMSYTRKTKQEFGYTLYIGENCMPRDISVDARYDSVFLISEIRSGNSDILSVKCEVGVWVYLIYREKCMSRDISVDARY